MAGPRGLFIPSRFDVAQARKDLETIRAAAKQAGANIRDEFLKGSKTATDFLKELRKQHQNMLSAAREAQQRGLIDPKQFAAVRREANRTFNEAILPALAQMRKDGKAGTEEFNRLQRALKNVGQAGSTGGAAVKRGFTDQVKDLPGLVKGAFGGAMIASFTYVAGKIVDTFRRMVRGINTVLQEASTAAQIREAFTLQASGQGLDPTRALAELRRGAKGMVTDVELMRRANRALQGELPVTERQLGDLAQLARKMADAVGGDVGDTLGSVMEALARGETRLLRQAVIYITLTDVLKRWEQQTGRNSASLSDHERKALLLNAVLEEHKRVLETVGDETVEAGERVQQATVFLQNLKTAIYESIANSPQLLEFLGGIGSTAEESAAKVQDLANRFGALVDTILQSPVVSTLVGIAKFEGKLGGKIGGAVLGIGGADYEHNLRKRQIQTADMAGLYRLQADAEYRFREMQADGVKAGDVRLEQLREELKLMKDRAAELQRQADSSGGGGGGDDPPVGLTPEELEKLRDRVKQYRDSMTSALDLELEKLREVRAAMLATGETDLLPGLDERIGHLEELKQGVRDLEAAAASAEPAITRAFESMGPRAIKAITDGLSLAQPALKKYEATMIRLREQRARGGLSDKQFQAAEKAAAQELNARLLAIIEQLREAGKLTPEVHEKLVGMLEGAAEGAEDASHAFGDVLDNLIGVARGVLSVADAMGVLDDDTRRAMQGVVDLAEGLKSIAEGNYIGGVAQGFGGLMALITGLAGDSGEDRRRALEAARRQLLAMASLERALRDLENAVLAETSEQQRNAIIQLLAPLTTQMRSLQMGGFNRVGIGPGMTTAELNAIKDLEEKLGIQIIDGTSLLVDNYLAAIDRLQDMDLGSFGSDLHGRLDALNFALDILGDNAGTAAQRLERFAAAIEDFAPDFAAQLRQRAAQDPEAAQAWLAGLAEAFAAGGLNDPALRALFGDSLTADQVKRLLEDANGYLGGILDEAEEDGDGGGTGETPGSTRSWTKDFTITEVTAQRLGGYMSSLVVLGMDSRELLREEVSISREILARLIGSLASVRAPNPAALATPGTGATSQVGPISLGGVHVNVPPGTSPADQEAYRSAGAAAGSGVMRTIDEGLGRRMLDQQRVTGRSARRLYAG
jgi:hypothetical protein